jgi:hypothetical protein
VSPLNAASNGRIGSSPLTADDLLVLDSVTEGKGAAAQAEKFLKEFLKDGPMAAQLCYEEATQRHISEAGLRRAKARLGVLHNEPRDLLGLYLPHTWELPSGQNNHANNQGLHHREGEAGTEPRSDPTPPLISGSVDENP